MDLAIHLSIDLSMAAASYMRTGPADGAHALLLDDIKMWITAIGAVHRIIGIDLVGLDMQSQSPSLPAVMACHLALTAMSAAHDRI
jgi:hypothetical protein